MFYAKYYSVTDILLELKLPCLDTVMHNNQWFFSIQSTCSVCENEVVKYYRFLSSDLNGLFFSLFMYRVAGCVCFCVFLI